MAKRKVRDDYFNEARIIIAGGRDFNDYDKLCADADEFIDKVIRLCINVGYFKNNKIIIVSGHARGADSLGERYAKERGYELKLFPADWNKYGKSAGYIRNKEMADYANCLVAFWNGESKGTENMIDLAQTNELVSQITKY